MKTFKKQESREIVFHWHNAEQSQLQNYITNFVGNNALCGQP